MPRSFWKKYKGKKIYYEYNKREGWYDCPSLGIHKVSSQQAIEAAVNRKLEAIGISTMRHRRMPKYNHGGGI